jgi:hypothetical protein
MKRKLLLVGTALSLAEKPIKSYFIPQLKKSRPPYTFLLYIMAAVLLLSCNDAVGNGLFSADDPKATSDLIIIPRRTIYSNNEVFDKNEDLSVRVTSDGEVIQIPLDQVQITIQIDNNPDSQWEVEETYHFTVEEIYRVTAWFRDMNNYYTILVGTTSSGTNTPPSTGSGGQSGTGNTGGVGWTWN